MFLVVNQNLCNHVKKFFTGLQHSHGYLQSPNNFVNTLINFKNIPETQFPLILTFSNFIQYLDATLENPFFSEEKETPAQQERKIQLDETTLGWEEFQEDADFDKTIFQKNSSKHIMNFSFYMQKIWHDLIKSKPYFFLLSISTFNSFSKNFIEKNSVRNIVLVWFMLKLSPLLKGQTQVWILLMVIFLVKNMKILEEKNHQCFVVIEKKSMNSF